MSSSTTSIGRVWILLRVRLRASSRIGDGIATLLFQAVLTGVFCGLVRDGLPPFPYGVFAFTLTTALIGVPLLGELGTLLRRDPAQDWVEALAIRPREVRLARTGELLWILGAQALACGLPAMLFAPEAIELGARLLLPLSALALALFLAAFLLCVQSLFGGRAEPLFVLFQTLLVAGVLVGGIVGLGHLDELARLPSLGDEYAAFLWFVPPAWFAAPLAGLDQGALVLLPLAIALASLGVLAALPAPSPVRRRGRREPLTALLLRPLRCVARRLWVRREERGVFDLVYDALPLEREFVLRSYPMLGIPIAFGALAAHSAAGPAAGSDTDLLAILLFTVGIYLPVLLTYVPATESPGAAWLHETAPVRETTVVAATIKALTVRFVAPLYVLLGILAWFLGGPGLFTRLVAPAFLTTLLVMRRLYPVCVRARPLSVAPDEVESDVNWLSVLGGAALGLTILGLLANRLLTGVGAVLLACTVLLALELASELRLAHSGRERGRE